MVKRHIWQICVHIWRVSKFRSRAVSEALLHYGWIWMVFPLVNYILEYQLHQLDEEFGGFWLFSVGAMSFYLSTSFTVAFSRGMRDTSAAVGTRLSPPSTPSTSARREACTSGWRDSSYSDQDMVLEIWKNMQALEVKLADLVVLGEEWRGGGRWGRSYRVDPGQQQLGDVAVDGLHREASLGQEVGQVATLYLLSARDLLRLGCHSLVNVTLGWRHRGHRAAISLVP